MMGDLCQLQQADLWSWWRPWCDELEFESHRRWASPFRQLATDNMIAKSHNLHHQKEECFTSHKITYSVRSWILLRHIANVNRCPNFVWTPHTHPWQVFARYKDSRDFPKIIPTNHRGLSKFLHAKRLWAYVQTRRNTSENQLRLVQKLPLDCAASVGAWEGCPVCSVPLKLRSFHSHAGTQNGWLMMQDPIEMYDLGVPRFDETSIWTKRVSVLGYPESLSLMGLPTTLLPSPRQQNEHCWFATRQRYFRAWWLWNHLFGGWFSFKLCHGPGCFNFGSDRGRQNSQIVSMTVMKKNCLSGKPINPIDQIHRGHTTKIPRQK